MTAVLEVIDKGCVSQTHPVPLLFVHGAWHAAWCWDEYFLSFFADKGYRALAVSFRGHGSSPTPKPLRTCSLADYVEDVSTVADSLPTRPVVIGHSMGGVVVQKYLRVARRSRRRFDGVHAPAGISRIRPALDETAPVAFHESRDHRQVIWLMSTPQSLHGRDSSPHRRRRPKSWTTRRGSKKRAHEPASTAFCSACPDLNGVTTTLLVLGALDDGAVTPKEVRATARAYRTEAEFFANMGHDMMLEPGWAAVAERIHTWLGTHGL